LRGGVEMGMISVPVQPYSAFTVSQ